MSPGRLPLCPTCGYSAPDVRVCRRGHLNTPSATRCTTCHTPRLSQPAPPLSTLDRVLWHLVRTTLTILTAAAVILLAFMASRDVPWRHGWPHLVALIIAIPMVYGSSLVLPGPVHTRAFPPFTKPAP